MTNNKTTGGVIEEIAKVIKEEIELTKDLTKQQFTINVEYLQQCIIISAEAVDTNHRIKTDNYLCEPEAVITGDILEAIREIIANR